MKQHLYQSFPKNIREHVFHIYPKKQIVVVDGFKKYSLKDLKNIPMNDRLSFPHDLFVAIHIS